MGLETMSLGEIENISLAKTNFLEKFPKNPKLTIKKSFDKFIFLNHILTKRIKFNFFQC